MIKIEVKKKKLKIMINKLVNQYKYSKVSKPQNSLK